MNEQAGSGEGRGIKQLLCYLYKKRYIINTVPMRTAGDCDELKL